MEQGVTEGKEGEWRRRLRGVEGDRGSMDDVKVKEVWRR